MMLLRNIIFCTLAVLLFFCYLLLMDDTGAPAGLLYVYIEGLSCYLVK